MTTKRKLILAVAAILALSSLVLADFDIRRAGSRVYVSGVGDISLETIAGKSVSMSAGTKKATFDLTNIANAANRTINIPNANSTTVQANTGAANQFLTAVSAQGVVSRGQPAFTDLSDNALFVNWSGIGAASVSGDQVFIAQHAYQVTGIKIVQSAQGGSGCVIDVEKLTGTTAPGAGTVIGTGSYNCNSTANNTVTTYVLTGTTGNLQLAAGDRLGLKLGGTLTALAGATVTIQLKAI
jgi:hypothetical protein